MKHSWLAVSTAMARLMLALFVIAPMIALLCSGTFGKVSTDTLAVLNPHHITYSIIKNIWENWEFDTWIFNSWTSLISQHFYCYYYLRNKDQYIKGSMVGESWVNVSLQLVLFGGFFIKLVATESLEFFFIPLRVFFYLGWWNMLSQSINHYGLQPSMVS